MIIIIIINNIMRIPNDIYRRIYQLIYNIFVFEMHNNYCNRTISTRSRFLQYIIIRITVA